MIKLKDLLTEASKRFDRVNPHDQQEPFMNSDPDEFSYSVLSKDPAQVSLFPHADVQANSFQVASVDKENTRTDKETQLMHIFDPKIEKAVTDLFGSGTKYKHSKPAERITWQGDDSAGNGAEIWFKGHITPSSGPGAGKPVRVWGQIPIAGKEHQDGPMRGMPLGSVGISVVKDSYKKGGTPFMDKQLAMFKDAFMSLSTREVIKHKDNFRDDGNPKAIQNMLDKYQYARSVWHDEYGGEAEYGFNFGDVLNQYGKEYYDKANIFNKAILKQAGIK